MITYSIDAIVQEYIAAYNPLKGAIFCDYVLNNQFQSDLVHEAFKSKEFHLENIVSSLPSRLPKGDLFWELIARYMCPTRFELATWHRILMRHCWAMRRSYLNKDQRNTKFPISFIGTEDFWKALANLDGCVKEPITQESVAHIAEMLKGSSREEVRHGNVLAACSQALYDYGDTHSNDRVDMRKINTDMLALMYRHIADCRERLFEWAQEETPYDSAGFELGQSYKDHYSNALTAIQEGEQKNDWLRYPSMLVAQPMYESRLYVAVTDDKTVFELDSDATYQGIQELLFYSNSMKRRQGGIGRAVENYVDHMLSSDKSNPNLYAVTRGLAISDYDWGPMDTIEPYNHRELTRLLTPVVESDIAALREHEPGPAETDEKAQEVAPTTTTGPKPKEDDPTKKATPATELDKKAKDDDNSTSALLLAGGLAVLFLAFGQR